MNRHDPLLSRPMDLHWMGWRSTTWDLQRAGWDISAEQNIERMQLSLAIRHPHQRAYGISQSMDYRYFEDDGYLAGRPVHADIRMGNEVHVHLTERPDFHAIDAQPQMRIVTDARRRLEDYARFAKAPLVMNNPVIVPHESVSDLMARILEMQQPDRTARIREQLRNPEGYERLPEQQFHAQIISFGRQAA